MTLEEAIQHCREVAEERHAEAHYSEDHVGCDECAAEHEQLAKWLEELLRRREDMAVQRGQSARLEAALLQAYKRIKDLEALAKEALAKQSEAYDKLYAAYAKIDELILAKEERG